MGAAESKKKKEGIAVTGTASLVTTGSGIALMAVGGPIGVVAGGIILGAGISGTVSTTQQALNKKEDFDYKQWGLQTGIGAAGGAIAAPISIAGGAIAGASGAALTNTAARVGIKIGADMAGGMAAAAGTKAIANAVEGKEISEGVGRQAVIGAITGGIASGATAGMSNVMQKATGHVSRVAL